METVGEGGQVFDPLAYLVHHDFARVAHLLAAARRMNARCQGQSIVKNRRKTTGK
jgi:hypothetical protein